MSESTISIADTPEALTASWLTEALRAAGHLDQASVTEVVQTPVGTGQMCDSVRLTLRYDAPTDAPPTVIAKLPAADETSRATALSLRSYENEVRFYQQLAPELPIRTPHVFHADIDVVTASFILLLEDMAPAGQGDQLLGCSPEVAKVAVDELVRLHAPRWDDPTLAEMEWLHRDRAEGQQFMLMMLPIFWDGFRERYAADLGQVIHQAGDALFADLEAYLTADTEPWSIVHGDYRLDNTMLAPDDLGTVVAVLDWEMSTLGDPLADLGLFLLYWGSPTAQNVATGEPIGTRPGFLSRDEVVARYAERSGRNVDHLDWYLVFASYKLAIIVEGINARIRMGKTLGEGFTESDQLVTALVEGALAEANRSSISALRG